MVPRLTSGAAVSDRHNQAADIAAGVTELRLKFPGEDRFVFKDLTIHVRQGEKVLLLGPSGSGKSTLLQVLSGIIPSLVEVPMRCKDQYPPASWGFVFQDPDTQFCMPYVDEELAFVLENLAVPRSEMRGRMDEVLRAVGLQLPELHVQIDSLSQGMKQRLALASVLLSNPQVLFLDEPSALLDPEGREQIWDTVKKISPDRTLIIVEHRIEEIADFVDRVILFGPEGQMLGEGAPQEVFSMYQSELKEFGIWYPGVWEHFFTSPEGEALLEPVLPKPPLTVQAEALLELSQFRGLRHGKSVIDVEHASIAPGDFIAITGPNGAGKSSLLLSLMGLLSSEGSYLLQGQPLDRDEHVRKWRVRWKKRQKQVKQAASQISFVFQNPEFQFVAEQVGEEIAFSLRQEGLSEEVVLEQVNKSLRTFGLKGLDHRHPYQLSLGQKRRLSVAGAAVLDKPILLLDEPTFGQDAVNTFAILQVCEELRRLGTAIVMVTHEEKIADIIATQRWEVREGKMISQQLTERGEEMKQLRDSLVQETRGEGKQTQGEGQQTQQEGKQTQEEGKR
ncbi:ABC transporter ATP-binding protein [Paenibacillus lentus]|uniref:ABC transporter ATP-binding protein n=1 Tax=Paenibacillus lentus TaxID=1338368 RepID=A0A3Q8S6C5_9BACL|nr:ABC transporter ATP-binding protein [Paenibacillus lentus]AZK48372.1 ABC transporter ATP-binding protein [Paenibacillus lentus]